MNDETAKASSEESKKYASNKEYQTTIFKMNVQDDKSVQDMVNFVVREFGRIDYAVNSAGVSDISLTLGLTLANLMRPSVPPQRLTTASTHPSLRRTSTTSIASWTSMPAATWSACGHRWRRCASRSPRPGVAGTAHVTLGVVSSSTWHRPIRSSGFPAKGPTPFRSMRLWASPKWQVSAESNAV